MSFVRTARDLAVARRHLAPGTRLIAKMEKPEAIENLDAIVGAADGLMVARGDLGVELPLERVPGIQKRLVRQANLLAKPCIVATEMLESMIELPRPTRAEVSDVANAVLDGADAVMLSAETAVGHDPVAAVATMARIIEEAERSVLARVRPQLDASVSPGIAAAAVEAARSVGAKVIVAYTESGYTARLVAAFRPPMGLLALTPNQRVVRQLALVWGVEAHPVPRVRSTDAVMSRARAEVRRRALAAPGDRMAIVAGVPLNEPGNTNLLTVQPGRGKLSPRAASARDGARCAARPSWRAASGIPSRRLGGHRGAQESVAARSFALLSRSERDISSSTPTAPSQRGMGFGAATPSVPAQTLPNSSRVRGSSSQTS